MKPLTYGVQTATVYNENPHLLVEAEFSFSLMVSNQTLPLQV